MSVLVCINKIRVRTRTHTKHFTCKAPLATNIYKTRKTERCLNLFFGFLNDMNAMCRSEVMNKKKSTRIFTIAMHFSALDCIIVYIVIYRASCMYRMSDVISFRLLTRFLSYTTSHLLYFTFHFIFLSFFIVRVEYMYIFLVDSWIPVFLQLYRIWFTVSVCMWIVSFVMLLVMMLLLLHQMMLCNRLLGVIKHQGNYNNHMDMLSMLSHSCVIHYYVQRFICFSLCPSVVLWVMRFHRDSEIKNKVQRLHTNFEKTNRSTEATVSASAAATSSTRLQAHTLLPKWTGKNVRNAWRGY